MGIPKTSRKGKKAWRRNIDAGEVEDFLQDETHKERRAPAVHTLKNEDLFVLDKEADDDLVPAAVRKRSRQEAKPLRSQLFLASLKDGITPVPQGPRRKLKGQGRPLPGSTAVVEDPAPRPAAVSRSKKRKHQEPVADLWADGPSSTSQQLDWAVPVPAPALLKAARRQQQQQQEAASARSSRHRSLQVAPMPAVEVDMPGCSFNPEYESHQDALAVAVAHEYKQELKQELMPKAPSQHAPEGYRPVDELDELLVDAEQSEDEDEQAAVGGKRQHKKLAIAAADDNEIVLDDEADAGGCAATAALQASARAVEDACPASAEFGTTAPAAAAAARKTKKDRNREARRKHQDMEIAAKQALKQQRQQLEALQELQQQLAQEHEEKAALRLRKQVNKMEKAAVQPPRLGKHKFEAAATAVLTSDEVTGSLRQLKPCFMVAADRFKALQKRGLIEPRKAAGRKQGKKVQYVAGERREKAEQRQQEVADMVAARKEANKQVAVGPHKGSKDKKRPHARL